MVAGAVPGDYEGSIVAKKVRGLGGDEGQGRVDSARRFRAAAEMANVEAGLNCEGRDKLTEWTVGI